METEPIARPVRRPPKKPRPGARGVRKVKTGCLTCKIRHKKCDEVRPACSQCVDTGRRCDFLSAAVITATNSPPNNNGLLTPDVSDYSSSSSSSLIALSHFPSPSPPPSFFTSISNDRSAMHFDYFRHTCAAEFSLFFDLPNLETILLQTASTEPAILHAAIANAAVARSRYQPWSGGGGYNDALRSYNRAIRELRGRERSREVVVLASIVFVNVEFMLGNYERVGTHLRGAFGILRGMTTIPGSAASSYLFTALSRVEDQIALLTAFANHDDEAPRRIQPEEIGES